MSTKTGADSEFQRFIRHFRAAFGIPHDEDIQTQQQEVLAEYVRIDALVHLPLTFDFHTLKDRLFPFLSPFTILEYKSQRDKLQPAHVYQYSFTELGLVVTRYLTVKRKDRSEWKSISQQAARAQWAELKKQGAQHSCCTIILSTTDATQLRKGVGFQPVDDYPHLEGALYRTIIREDEFIGSVATYLVVLNDLPVCAKNAPLLLLTTQEKKIEFCQWLLSEGEGITLEERRYYQRYLLEHDMIEDEEVEKIMRRSFFGPPDHSWIFEEFAQRPEEEQRQFKEHYNRIMLQANSPEEVAQKALGVSSMEEVAQKALGADSPVEAALKLLKNEEQLREFLARIPLAVGSPEAAASA